MKLDIVIPIYNEMENLPELQRRLTQVCDTLAGIEWRVLYVNDGSRDDSVKIIREQHRTDPRLCLIELSRNFGHQAAISAGVAYADADAVILMDGDLQDPPEVIPALVDSWQTGGEVVRAVRCSRKEQGIRRLGFELFHRCFGYLTDYPIPAQAGIFGLLDRKALEQLQQLPERNRFIPGLRSWIGFDQRIVEYNRQERAAGEPKQTLLRLVRYALDGIFSFSYKPLRLMTWMGVVICLIGFALANFFIWRRLLGIEHALTGFTTLVTIVLFLGGIQLVGIGVLGEYLGRIYDEVKRRPLFIVKETVGVASGATTTTGELRYTRG
jgi:dolichol-phosphate mannosyltransferase